MPKCSVWKLTLLIARKITDCMNNTPLGSTRGSGEDHEAVISSLSALEDIFENFFLCKYLLLLCDSTTFVCKYLQCVISIYRPTSQSGC